MLWRVSGLFALLIISFRPISSHSMRMRASIFMCLALVLPIYADVGDVPKIRPAEAACNKFQKEFSNLTTESVIFNEGNAQPGELPFVVSLQYLNRNKTHLRNGCSGSLITTKHVLTTANCIDHARKFIPIQVRSGVVALNLRRINATDIRNEQTRSIAKITFHPKYNRTKFYYDIAIIELSTPIDVTKYVKPVCLQYTEPQLLSSVESANWKRLAAGWIHRATKTHDLFKTDGFKFVEQTVCSESYGSDDRLDHGLDDSMICIEFDKNVQFGDGHSFKSGGPLLQKKNQVISLVAMSNFGFEVPMKPEVYRSVYYYLDWIEEVVWPKEVSQPEI